MALESFPKEKLLLRAAAKLSAVAELRPPYSAVKNVTWALDCQSDILQ